MKNSIIFLVLIVLNVFAQANEISEICQNLLISKKLNKDILKPIGKIDIYDINGDGIDEKVVIDSLREDLPFSLSIYDNEHSKNMVSVELYEEVRFDEGIQVFHHQDKYYILHYRTKKNIVPTYLTYINSKNIEIPKCKFRNEKKLILKENNTSICKTLLKRYKKTGTIIFDIPSKFKFDVTKSKREYGFNPTKTTIGNMAYFDFNNNGVKEYVQLFEGVYDSKIFYKIIEKKDMKILTNNENLKAATGEWLRYQDKVYFVNGYIENINKPLFIGLIDNNISKAVCTYAVDTEIMLDINQTKSFFKVTK